jgi:hypothetical protein
LNIDDDLAELSDLSSRLILFPVRHHSPTAARLVREAIATLQPAAVLIEGPADFNERLAELRLPHRLPIAIYSYLVLMDGETPVRRGVYYPFCEHSPEWQATQATDAVVRFIDLPWADLVLVEGEETTPTNRYADRVDMQNDYVRGLCQRLGVETFHEVWDELFEIDADITLTDYLKRCHRFCRQLRHLGGPVSASDAARELFMATHIRAALTEFTGPVLVVLGGYHAAGILHLLRHTELPTSTTTELATIDRGIALTPYSFERLDSLTGYNSGMPNPGFYQQVWQTRLKHSGTVHQSLTAKVVVDLRQKKQPISAADWIAAETTAQALAAMRSHAEVWRTDWLDGLTAALIKDDVSAGMTHPILTAIHAVLRGGERGALAEGTTLPPLVLDIQRQLAMHNLHPAGPVRTVRLDLAQVAERDKSRLLHRLRVLVIPGFRLVNDAQAKASQGEFIEEWRLSWSPDFDANCIENSRYGVTLVDAAQARLTESAQAAQRDAGIASALLMDAALAGLEQITTELIDLVTRLIRTDGDFINVSSALEQVLFLFRYDPVLGTAGRADFGGLLWETYDRAVWLLESLGQLGERPQEILPGIQAILETYERCEAELALDGEELRASFRRVAADRAQLPLVRGATLGGLWVLQDTDGERVTTHLQEFTDPDHLGDFLTGLFALAREQAQRHKALLQGIHDVLVGYSVDQYLAALPALRLAFTFFTPREKHHLAVTLRQLLGLMEEPEMAALTSDVGTVARAMQLEARLVESAKTYGIRGFDS